LTPLYLQQLAFSLWLSIYDGPAVTGQKQGVGAMLIAFPAQRWRLSRLQSALALGRITPLVTAVVRATRSPNHARYGESPAQAALAVVADLPSGMGGEASRASGSTPEAVAGQSRAGSTPRITRTNQSCVVSANANPASSTGQHSADQPSSRARPGCTTSI
jgi:hypothetical protein